MSKNIIIAIVVFVCIVAALAYFFGQTGSISTEDRSATEVGEQSRSVSSSASVRMNSSEYQSGVKDVFSRLRAIENGGQVDKESLMGIKNDFLALRVPAEFKDLHLQILLAISDVEKFIDKNDESGLLDSRKAISILGETYSWLN